MYRAILLFNVSALLASLGCSESEADACSDEQVYDDGACIPKPAATAGAPATNEGGAPTSSEGGAPTSGEGGAPAAAEGGAPPASTGGASGDAAFGATCEDHPDCQGATDYCAKSPVAPPYCTAAGCDETPDICPQGWACFDVSQFSPGEPWICMQPL